MRNLLKTLGSEPEWDRSTFEEGGGPHRPLDGLRPPPEEAPTEELPELVIDEPAATAGVSRRARN
jgi:hypothetical protein